MLSDKEQKKKFKKIASKEPEKYYPVTILKEEGFIRKLCTCGTYFWTTDPNREKCGDPACSGGFQVVENNPSKHKLSYIGVWKKIVEVLEPRGYKPIKRYPVIARWNPTTEFTIASIAAFQPYVISGESDPPAKMLIIPQFCLRFVDIENVGITGSHCTGFVMIGQHVFLSPKEWNQAKYFRDIYDFLIDGVGLSKHEIIIHEDAWAGGGSYGPCMEFFSRGVELFNQVYTMFEQTPTGDRELKLKVLDMGLGQERVAWFSQGTPNIYEATFPAVLKKLKEITKINQDFELYKKFSRYSAYLNIDEVEDIDKAWDNVARELGMDVEDLKNRIMPMTGIYSIAEHSRALLFAISDGKLPSNVGGGYNLRAIFRRAVSFAEQFNWDINLSDVCRWHAEELYELFPEVSEHLDEVEQVFKVEYEKYYATKKKAAKIIKKIIEKGNITEDILLKLYDSNGISPDMVISEAKKMNIVVKKPDNFYSKVLDLHEQKEQIHQTYKELDIQIDSDIPDTVVDYYDDYLKFEEKVKVLFIEKTLIEDETCWAVIADRTIAYPTSGGQLHDIGTIDGTKFSNVVKFRGYIVHCLDKKPRFKVGDEILIKLDEDWRRQLAAHHTATHVINAAAREILGDHINQASAKKTYDKAHLDITHYDSLTDEDTKKIEDRANEIIAHKIPIKSNLFPRSEAEQKYGMRLYQGGAVPGKLIRVVEITGEDVEACGGTHMHNTSEIGKIKIIKTQKVQDGIVRITFTGGQAVNKLEETNKKILEHLSEKLKVKIDEFPARLEELTEKIKLLQKSLTTSEKPTKILLNLTSSKKTKKNSFEMVEDLCDQFKCSPDSLIQTIDKNLEEYERLVSLANEDNSVSAKEDNIIEVEENIKLLIKELNGFKPKEIISISQNILKEHKDLILIILSSNGVGVSINGLLGATLQEQGKINLGSIMRKIVGNLGGKGGGKAINFQGYIPINDEFSLESIKSQISNQLESLIKKN